MCVSPASPAAEDGFQTELAGRADRSHTPAEPDSAHSHSTSTQTQSQHKLILTPNSVLGLSIESHTALKCLPYKGTRAVMLDLNGNCNHYVSYTG